MFFVFLEFLGLIKISVFCVEGMMVALMNCGMPLVLRWAYTSPGWQCFLPDVEAASWAWTRHAHSVAAQAAGSVARFLSSRNCSRT